MKIIQFDGAAIPNPGSRGIGVILIDEGVITKEISKKLEGVGTNNEAEYFALIEGLRQAVLLGWKDVLVQGDSKLVINQVNGSWAVNKDNLKKLNSDARRLLKEFDSIKLEWIARERNSRADYAASKALGFIEDPLHKAKNVPKNKTKEKKEDNIGIFCPKCKLECMFEWQIFKNGTKHIRQSCPKHGYIRYAPKTSKYLEKANSGKNSDKEISKNNLVNVSLTCYDCSKFDGCKLIEQGFAEICEHNK